MQIRSAAAGLVVLLAGLTSAYMAPDTSVSGGRDSSLTADQRSGEDSSPGNVQAVEPVTVLGPAYTPGRPLRLVVPGIHVDAPVVGIDVEGGVLDPPSDPRTVGWWSQGAQPGAETGTALLTAHTVHTGGGAFDDLAELRPGAPVLLTTTQGQLDYRVLSVTTYPKSSLAAHAPELFDQTTHGRLALVTCDDWDGEHYLSNTVVLATR